MRLVRPLLVLAALLVVAAPTVDQATAASGGLRFVECLTGKQPVLGEPRSPRGGGCKLTKTVAGDGEGSAINHLSALTASPDGRSLYAVSIRDDAVSAFTARPLRLTQCFTTNAHLRKGRKQPCQLLPNSGSEDVNSGLNGVNFVAVSPDGRDVYTASSGDGSIATFARAASGQLDFEGCITGNSSTFGSAANGSCQRIPGATNTLDGAFSGLGGPRSLAISPDGRFVYVALGTEDGIATLARDADGSLRFLSCLRGAVRYAELGPLHSPCPLVAPQENNPNASGLKSPVRIVISADGTSLYATSARGASIAEFRRDPADGALTFSGCLAAANRGTGPGDPCRYVPQANDIGVDTAMYEMREIVIAPDGTGLYGISTYDDAVAAFARDPATGKLSFASCIGAESDLGKEFGVPDPCTTEVPSTNAVGDGSGLARPRGLAISPDGRNLFVASLGDATINRFRLTPGGGLHLAGCITDGSGRASRCPYARTPGGKPQWFGFDGLNSLAVAGHSLYAAAGDGSSISRFSFP